jgi:hypothetical protein
MLLQAYPPKRLVAAKIGFAGYVDKKKAHGGYRGLL